MSVRTTVEAQMRQVATEHDKVLEPLNDDLVLLESGLDSLCFAILVARLEDELGYDPFATSEDVAFPTTVGDFIRFYDRVPA